jgi:primosomal protein N' (replication factor Y)
MPASSANGGSSYLPRFVTGTRVAVLLPLPLAGPYDYRVGSDMALQPGDFVEVPLGGRAILGVVWGVGTGDVPEAKTKTVRAHLENVPPLPEPTRKLIDWVAGYTLSAQGAVLRMAMSVSSVFEPDSMRQAYRFSGALPPPRYRDTEARRRVLDAARESGPHTATELARLSGAGTAVVKGLAELGLLQAVAVARDSAIPIPDPEHPSLPLSPAQAEAAAHLRQSVGEGFSVTLLEGVTGSGKTEVYFEAVAEAMRRGGQVLVLLPEIALSSQWLERFERRFGVVPLEWHSDLADRQRRQTWRAVASGEGRVVVGARSALFLPFPRLGLIVVDEEHETSFKQEEGVIYQARDMAVVRSRLADHPCVLASATPSLETIVNVRQGRYRRLHLPNRHGGAEMPEIACIDLRRHPPARGRFLSPALVEALVANMATGEQSMLFLNRRGYAPLTLCRTCGHRLQCPHCTAWLVEHRLLERLQCHHCGFAQPLPQFCPHCQAADSFAACGPGVERVAEEIASLMPKARLAVMASDTLFGPRAAADLVTRMAAHEIDILVGTQIMAKGHHFPMLTLVGVVDADLGLAGGDLRAAERTYQLLNQVAGRAGRAAHPGKVMLQTYDPAHPVLAALVSGDFERFMAEESEAREAAGMPPFGRLAALIVSGEDAALVDRVAASLARTAPRGDRLAVLGPAPAPLSLLRGRHRRRLLLKADRKVNVQSVLRTWLSAVALPNSVRLQVDIDPYSFL